MIGRQQGISLTCTHIALQRLGLLRGQKHLFFLRNVSPLWGPATHPAFTWFLSLQIPAFSSFLDKISPPVTYRHCPQDGAVPSLSIPVASFSPPSFCCAWLTEDAFPALQFLLVSPWHSIPAPVSPSVLAMGSSRFSVPSHCCWHQPSRGARGCYLWLFLLVYLYPLLIQIFFKVIYFHKLSEFSFGDIK